ncbi:NAD-dependent epimerase/dehydratase family protein [Candidatus Gottesmanbacteria bacterium]|nr:NAD-dependent epimerase/dehydratase family protein [Candidatus Gottesmanbacteria bacterium]
MKAILVTGGAGFIGSHLADYIIENGDSTVVVLDDLSGGFVKNIHPKAIFVKGTITNRQLINQLFRKYRFTYVYHLAAYAAEGLSHFIKRFNYMNNLIGSIHLINASVNFNVRCFAFTSSIAVYGTNKLPMTEDLKPKPEDSYGIAKYAVEKELEVTHTLFGLPYVIFRPHNVYGERQNIGDKYRNVIGIFMNNILQGKDLIIFGDGKQIRAFSYIKDIIPGIAQSVANKRTHGQIFNIGSDIPTSVNELAEEVMEIMGRRVPIRHVRERKEVKNAYSNHAKFKKFFPKFRETSLTVGLEAMTQWVKTEGARKSKRFKNIEIRKNLPQTWG